MAAKDTKDKTLKSYKALTGIQHNGETYVAGDKIELSDIEAAPLVAGKAVEPTDAKSA